MDGQAWEVSTGGTQPVPTLSCDAEEADTRVWLYVLRSPGTLKLVCSPETDVYHIGLPLISNEPLDIFVCSEFSEHRYLSSLHRSLEGDPDFKTNALLHSLQERQSLHLDGAEHASENVTCLWSKDSEAASSRRLRSNDLGT